ncbi:hypothetical protein EYZ11_009527 [Aspergillus tanneri]|uniref:Uncharacterized protein n=1 Tax=Aspergillus tanneri TaxID=1220188 RepID=A0A4S3J7Q4_9EURO|nr:hypothetical protein EYZ11_009527 [Aspergillus tanneri]
MKTTPDQMACKKGEAFPRCWETRATTIDVVLSILTGAQFLTALEDYFDENVTKYADEALHAGVPSTVTGIYRSDRKPEKSKHLEVGTTHIFGLLVTLWA